MYLGALRCTTISERSAALGIAWPFQFRHLALAWTDYWCGQSSGAVQILRHFWGQGQYPRYPCSILPGLDGEIHGLKPVRDVEQEFDNIGGLNFVSRAILWGIQALPL